MNIYHNSKGQLCYTSPQGTVFEGLTVVRAFPISAPQEGISLLDAHGHEVIWLDNWGDAPEAAQAKLEQELRSRDCIPIIERLLSVNTFATPSTWQVQTDRGNTTLLLKGEEDIRRLPDGGLLIQDGHGLTFRITHFHQLDRESRRLLDRFL